MLVCSRVSVFRGVGDWWLNGTGLSNQGYSVLSLSANLNLAFFLYKQRTTGASKDEAIHGIWIICLDNSFKDWPTKQKAF